MCVMYVQHSTLCVGCSWLRLSIHAVGAAAMTDVLLVWLV